MGRNTGGIYSLPGSDFVSGTVISSTAMNTKFNDVEAALTDSLSRAGNGDMLAPLRVPDGSAAIPSFSWSSDIGTGFYLAATSSFRAVILASTVQEWTATSVAINKALTVAAAATLTSTLGVTGAATLSSTLGVTGTTTLTGLLTANGGITSNGLFQWPGTAAADESPLMKTPSPSASVRLLWEMNSQTTKVRFYSYSTGAFAITANAAWDTDTSKWFPDTVSVASTLWASTVASGPIFTSWTYTDTTGAGFTDAQFAASKLEFRPDAPATTATAVKNTVTPVNVVKSWAAITTTAAGGITVASGFNAGTATFSAADIISFPFPVGGTMNGGYAVTITMQPSLPVATNFQPIVRTAGNSGVTFSILDSTGATATMNNKDAVYYIQVTGPQ